jgi:stage II sporulation protein D
MWKKRALAVIAKWTACALAGACLAGCAQSPARPSPTPARPTQTPAATASPPPNALAQAVEKLGLEKDEQGDYLVNVYLSDSGSVSQMPLESYLCGVVAAEMQPDWPQEALKAQAIIARTFTVRFLVQEGGSRYEGADVSDDTGEVQAYDASRVSDAVRQAVQQTRGMILSDGEGAAYTWFHAHSGGQTAGAVEGLSYEHGDLPYIVSVSGMENDEAPQQVQQWSAAFTQQQLLDAAQQIGYPAKSAQGFSVAETGQSGRAVSFDLDGVIVPAPALRTALGADVMRSTMIDEIDAEGDKVLISGRGYGHGVGMSQWGAYAMASQGGSAQDILAHFYPGTTLEQVWE